MKFTLAFLLIALISASHNAYAVSTESGETTTLPTTHEPSEATTLSSTPIIPETTSDKDMTTGKTTEAPTTHEVPTTTHEVPTTTHEVPTTTHEVPTTTHEIPTTTHEIPTTVVPHLSTSFSLNGTKGVCLKLDLQFNITVEDSINNITYVYDPENIILNTEKSSCNESGDQVLHLDFGYPQAGDRKSLTFTFEKKEKNIFVSLIEVFLFNQTKNESTSFSGHLNGSYFTVEEGLTYRCNSEQIEAIKGSSNSTISLKLENVKYLAFKTDGKDDFTAQNVCDQDTKIGEIVPIAVGCALAALILIILIAYVIGRRRTRQKGYQSV